MKLGINTSIWEITGLSLYDIIDKVSEMKFRYVDIFAVGSADPTKIKGERQDQIVKKFKDHNLISSNMVMLPPGNIASANTREKEKCMDYLKSCVEFQAKLGGRQILLGFGGGSLTFELSRERAWANSVVFIRKFCEWLSRMNILLTLELDPFVFNVINDTTSMARIIADINMDNVFANIDLGHLAITREPPVALEKLREKIIHVHISDNDGEHYAKDIIGTGVTPIPAYIKKLIEMNIDETCARYGEIAVATIELGEGGKNVKDSDGYVRRSLDYIEQNIPELKR